MNKTPEGVPSTTSPGMQIASLIRQGELLPTSVPVSPTQPQSLYANERPSLKESSQWFVRLLLQIVLVAFWIGLAGGAYFVVRTLLDNPNQPDASSVNEGNRPDIPVEAAVAAPANKK